MKLNIEYTDFDRAFAEYEASFTAEDLAHGRYPDEQEFYAMWMEAKASRKLAKKPMTKAQELLQRFMSECPGRSYKGDYLIWCNKVDADEAHIYSEKSYLKALKK